MEKWKEFIKGAYFGFLGVGLVIFILNDVYWSFKEPAYQVDFQLHYSGWFSPCTIFYKSGV